MKSTVTIINPVKKKYPCLMMKESDGFIILATDEHEAYDGDLFHVGTVVHIEQPNNHQLTKIGHYNSCWRGLVPFYGTVTLSSDD